MRILYLHQYFVTPDTGGGTRSYEFARRWVAAGHSVAMITSRRQPSGPRGWTSGTCEGIAVYALKVPYSNAMGYGRRIVAFLRFAVGAARQAVRLRGDVIYATSTPLTIAIPALLASWWLRIPMVFEVRDLWPDVPIRLGILRNRCARRAARLLERLAYRRAQHIVALSPGMARGIVSQGVPGRKVSVVPNGCDVDAFSSASDVALACDWAGCAHRILYAGALGAVNGVGYVADIAANMRGLSGEVGFLIVGGGREREAVRARAGALGVLGQNLWMLDSIPKRDVAGLFRRADLVMSVVVDNEAMWDNSANKVFDAFAAGRPVAINYRGWQAGILEESGAGIVLPAADPAAAAKQIIEFLKSESRVGVARAAAAELARGRFNRDKQARQALAVVVDAAERSGRDGT